MRFQLLMAVIIIIVNIGVDTLIYRHIKQKRISKGWGRLYLFSSLALYALVIVLCCLPKRNGSDGQLLFVMWSLYSYITIYLPRYIYLIFRGLSRIPKLWHGRPWSLLSGFGGFLAVIIFGAMWWGALINRFNIEVHKAEIPVAGLPKAFDGFKIAQISDIHVGTYGSDTTFVSELIDSVNALHPDLIVFTGDIVNRQSAEFKPFISTFSRLHAPYGVYSVMGNHDYGDYSDWPSVEAKDQDVVNLKKMQTQAGLKMLNNATDWIHIGSDSIALIGVENIGDPPFKSYGDLKAAYPDITDRNTKILLTHNPAHWENDIENTDANIALTLSGHTHAMQCEAFGISPASLRYDRWGGLYTDTVGHNLYVNIGAGTVGMPYRIGATPEITLLTLTSK